MSCAGAIFNETSSDETQSAFHYEAFNLRTASRVKLHPLTVKAQIDDSYSISTQCQYDDLNRFIHVVFLSVYMNAVDLSRIFTRLPRAAREQFRTARQNYNYVERLSYNVYISQLGYDSATSYDMRRGAVDQKLKCSFFIVLNVVARVSVSQLI